MEGTYFLNDSIYLKDNIELVGEGSKTILKKNKGYLTKICSSIKNGDNKINVENSKDFLVGDGITIIGDSLSPAFVWVTQVKEKCSDFLLLKDPITYDLNLSTNPFVYSSFPCIYCKNNNNVCIKNLQIDGNYKENYVINSWWDSCIGIKDSNYVSIDNVFVINSSGDGISLNNSNHVNITNCLVSNSARLGVHVGCGSQFTYFANTKIENSGLSEFINFDGLFLCFNASYGTYENNEIINNKRAGISLGRGDSNNFFFNNKVSGNQIGIYFRLDTDETNNLEFIQNTIENNSLYDLFAEQPIHYVFMDNWPLRNSIPFSSSFLYKLNNSMKERFQ